MYFKPLMCPHSCLARLEETPVGIVYQIQGHAPCYLGKTLQKRPIDLLRK